MTLKPFRFLGELCGGLFEHVSRGGRTLLGDKADRQRPYVGHVHEPHDLQLCGVDKPLLSLELRSVGKDHREAETAVDVRLRAAEGALGAERRCRLRRGRGLGDRCRLDKGDQDAASKSERTQTAANHVWSSGEVIVRAAAPCGHGRSDLIHRVRMRRAGPGRGADPSATRSCQTMLSYETATMELSWP